MFSDTPLHAPRVLILHAPGTNRDGDLANAIRIAGGDPIIMPLSRLRADSVPLERYAMLALPGGFSYGDALGAGRLWALELASTFQDVVRQFVDRGKAVIGICNGFQALVKAGVLSGPDGQVTLTYNASGRFECRWVRLLANPANKSPWLEELEGIECPVAHGEGRFLLSDDSNFPTEQVALQYAGAGGLADGSYPLNPNGSYQDIAGITNPAGNVLGLMPHPEDHIYPWQHPVWTRGDNKGLGVRLFENGLNGF